MGGRREGKEQKEVRPIVVPYEATLEDIYNGREVEVEIERYRMC